MNNLNILDGFNDYQERCEETDMGNKGGRALLKPDWTYYAFGIAEEQGELLGKLKKLFRDKEGVIDAEFKDAVIGEMGDMLWYMARLCSKFDLPFSQVPMGNLNKLQSRKERNVLHGDGDNR